MNIGSTVRKARRNLGYSQAELARHAGVGVATLQNIEGNRANPSINTLLAIFKVLGVGVRLEIKKAAARDWDEMAFLGCPIKAQRDLAGAKPASRSVLCEILRGLDPVDFNGREAKAIAAWLVALRDHFPSVWIDTPARLRAWASNQVPNLKLRRIALSRLAEFL